MQNLQPLIIESAQLMLIGMGTVFIILVMLIFLINIVSKLLSSLSLDDGQDEIRAAFGVNRQKPANTSDQQLIAVISSAISTYKKQHPTN